ncbi:lectin MOA-related protein [Xenorhabdus szentirmaii]|uniref:Agglutinin C-terminal domain-containing protein n=2 Tax=Xenorhabdus szentirmaii TaxID=290112 RepID=W1J7Y3_9GAMM|nr:MULTISPECIES: lectin MOA-related protein [Xenorhabdus]MBD2782154.1 lectin MOA-related protein [Xenorhabdus sp. 38]MBD2801081.1 lectin MOA-related protein [Xenorhabdus sp. M]MBD2805561.1 lectin MOA-related protein [Xenorhabdus sp. ZM]MBD2821649.1 lectin MOA-related protein [Xenorhabdus sp. 42]PHM35283.1 hypothetical protein Xsze_01750 [Xenorhabdus szentirmaii DSM 16338]
MAKKHKNIKIRRASDSDGKILPTDEDEVSPYAYYLIKDVDGNILSIDDRDDGEEKYAYMGSDSEKNNYSQFVTIRLSDEHRLDNTIEMVGKYKGKKYEMYAYDNTVSLESTDLYWHSHNENIADSRISFNIDCFKTVNGIRQYRLIWHNQGVDFFLSNPSPGEGTPYLKIHQKKYTLYTFYAKFVDSKIMKDLIRKIWPKMKISLASLRTLDKFYKLVSEEEIKEIYRESGLVDFEYRKESFDCDDFSFVYKAQVSKKAYANNEKYGYAIGVIFGFYKKSAHSVNIFIDHELQVKFIEPQTGRIIDPKNWKYKPYFVLI